MDGLTYILLFFGISHICCFSDFASGVHRIIQKTRPGAKADSAKRKQRERGGGNAGSIRIGHVQREAPDCTSRHCLRREVKHHLAIWSLDHPMDRLQTTSGPYQRRVEGRSQQIGRCTVRFPVDANWKTSQCNGTGTQTSLWARGNQK